MSRPAWDYMFFDLEGVGVPELLETVEPSGATAELFENELFGDAVAAVVHYFKNELGRRTMSLGELLRAIEKVIRGLALAAANGSAQAEPLHVAETDLRRLACDSGKGCELVFFGLLRDEVRERLRPGPQVLHFRGLRGCVKQLAGARRWNQSCRQLEEQIVHFLRGCLNAEAPGRQLAMLVN